MQRKIVTALFATYMLTLFLIPCSGNCDSEEHETSMTVQAAQEPHNEDHDSCSPFCCCACCSSLITVVHSAELIPFVPSVEKEFPLLSQSFISAFADDCWQPPRIG